MRTNPKNGKAQGGNPRLFSNDPSREASIDYNDTHDSATRLVFIESGIQYAQFHLAELAFLTDYPESGIVEAADALDLAQSELAKARGRL